MSAEHTETHQHPEQTNASGRRPPLLAMMANVWGMAVVLWQLRSGAIIS